MLRIRLEGFEYAERYQTLVFGFSDLDLGMNNWVCTGFEYPSEEIEPVARSYVQQSKFPRLKTTAGTEMSTATGSHTELYLIGSRPDPIPRDGHDEDGIYSEEPDVYRKLMMRLKRKIDNSRADLPAPVMREEEEQDVGIIYMGSMENTIQEIDDMIEKTGLKVSQCRIRAMPIHPDVEGFIERHQRVIVLEINRDGQLYGVLRKELPNDLASRISSVAYSDGMPPRARIYADMILETLGEVKP